MVPLFSTGQKHCTEGQQQALRRHGEDLACQRVLVEATAKGQDQRNTGQCPQRNTT